MSLRFVHFYPFRPRRSDGGSLRLATGVAATTMLGDTTVVWYDSQAGVWRTDNAKVHDGGGEYAQPASSRLKRTVFPHTLFESGRRAVEALERGVFATHIDADAVPVLHTSYLAPMLRNLGARSAILDVYDLLWMAHRIEARRPSIYWPVRAAYASSVRARELPLLSLARALVVAGWEDWHSLSLSLPSVTSRWCPTGLTVNAVDARHADGILRVGFLGNFAHEATRTSAEALLRAPVSQAPDVQVVLGGWGSDASDEWQQKGATVLGAVDSVEAFWSQIDVAVVPVETGTGMKCKIAEAMLAGRAVVTTALGAAGFDPSTRARLLVVDSVDALDEAACRRAQPAPREITRQFHLETAAATYRDLLQQVL